MEKQGQLSGLAHSFSHGRESNRRSDRDTDVRPGSFEWLVCPQKALAWETPPMSSGQSVPRATTAHPGTLLDKRLPLSGAGAVLSLAIGLWFTIGPWTVSDRSGSLSCGSPFMGRYRPSNPDTAASLFYACWQQAGIRLAVASAGLIFGVVLAIYAAIRWGLAPTNAAVAHV